MESLWVKIAESSPIIAVLGVIIYYMFGYLKKKDEIIQQNSATLLEMQKQTIQSHQSFLAVMQNLQTGHDTINKKLDDLADTTKDQGRDIRQILKKTL